MALFGFLKRKPLDPATLAGLSASAKEIRKTLVDLETALELSGDTRTLAKAHRLHRHLDEMLVDHGAALGINDVGAFSGGGSKPPRQPL